MRNGLSIRCAPRGSAHYRTAMACDLHSSYMWPGALQCAVTYRSDTHLVALPTIAQPWPTPSPLCTWRASLFSMTSLTFKQPWFMPLVCLSTWSLALSGTSPPISPLRARSIATAGAECRCITALTYANSTPTACSLAFTICSLPDIVFAANAPCNSPGAAACSCRPYPSHEGGTACCLNGNFFWPCSASRIAFAAYCALDLTFAACSLLGIAFAVGSGLRAVKQCSALSSLAIALSLCDLLGIAFAVGSGLGAVKQCSALRW